MYTLPKRFRRSTIEAIRKDWGVCGLQWYQWITVDIWNDAEN